MIDWSYNRRQNSRWGFPLPLQLVLSLIFSLFWEEISLYNSPSDKVFTEASFIYDLITWELIVFINYYAGQMSDFKLKHVFKETTKLPTCYNQ